VKLTLQSIFTVVNHNFKIGKALKDNRMQVLGVEGWGIGGEEVKDIQTWDINKIQ
jgi:hypothetical protein